jgi:hypothetical protein
MQFANPKNKFCMTRFQEMTNDNRIIFIVASNAQGFKVSTIK